MRARQHLLNLSLLMVAVLLCVLVAEGVVRLRHYRSLSATAIPERGNAETLTAAYETTGLSYGSQANFAEMVYDPVVTYRPRSSNSGRGYRINRQGFRYPEDLKEPKPANEVRLFVLGGSFAFGAGCPDGHTYLNAMEAVLRQRAAAGKTVRVLGAGVGAYQGLQEYLLMTSRVSRFEPDLVVFVSGWNDIYFGSRGQTPFSGNDTMNFGAAIDGCVRRDFVTYDEDTKVFHNTSLPPRWDDYRFKLHFVIDDARYRSRSLEGSPQEEIEPAPAARVLEEIQLLLAGARDFAARRGFDLLYVLQPDLYSTRKPRHSCEQSLLDSYRSRYPGNEPYFVERFAEFRTSMPPFFLEAGIPFIDSEEALRTRSADECFFVDHVHFGERGQKWFGQYLGNLLATRMEQKLGGARP